MYVDKRPLELSAPATLDPAAAKNLRLRSPCVELACCGSGSWRWRRFWSAPGSGSLPGVCGARVRRVGVERSRASVRESNREATDVCRRLHPAAWDGRVSQTPPPRGSQRLLLPSVRDGGPPKLAHPLSLWSRYPTEMRMLAALMVSMTLLTTVLLTHAIATADDRDAPRQDPVTIRDSAQQLAVVPGR